MIYFFGIIVMGDNMEQIIQLLKNKDYQVSKILFLNYKKLNITEIEFIVLMYLLNNESIYNPKQISSDMSIELNSVLEIVNNLCEKGVISINLAKIGNITNEIINFDLLYEKLSFILLKEENKEESSNIFDIFERELGRTLSPMEYEIINGWKDNNITEEIIVLALKEATYNGVSNFRYIDKIIYEWSKKGIKTKEDVENNRKNFKKENTSKKEIFDYDWLNDE